MPSCTRSSRSVITRSSPIAPPSPRAPARRPARGGARGALVADLRGGERDHDLAGQPRPDHARAEAEHVRPVVLDGLMGGVAVVDRLRADRRGASKPRSRRRRPSRRREPRARPRRDRSRGPLRARPADSPRARRGRRSRDRRRPAPGDGLAQRPSRVVDPDGDAHQLVLSRSRAAPPATLHARPRGTHALRRSSDRFGFASAEHGGAIARTACDRGTGPPRA